MTRGVPNPKTPTIRRTVAGNLIIDWNGEARPDTVEMSTTMFQSVINDLNTIRLLDQHAEQMLTKYRDGHKVTMNAWKRYGALRRRLGLLRR
jgi:hypothetical protein